MRRRFLLALPLLSLAQCTPTSAPHQVSVLPPVTVEAQQQIPQRPSEEQLELFNYALDQA